MDQAMDEASAIGSATAPSTGESAVPDGPVTPSRRAALLRTGLVVGILVVVFGVILPRAGVDYADVLATFQALTLGQLVLMLAAVVVAWLVSGAMFPLLMGHLSLIRGTQAYLILSGIGASVPMGPWNMGVLWVVLRGWGVPNKPATSGMALYGVINQLNRLLTPLIALVAVTFVGAGQQGYDVARFLAWLSAAIFVVATAILVAIVRSDRTAGWVARFGDRMVQAVARRLGRSVPSVGGAILAFRGQLGDVVRQRGLVALLVGTLGQLTWCAVLILALRIVGIPAETLTAVGVLAVFALTSAITIIPIAPGGAGIPELLYIAGLTAITGPSWEAQVTAGVMLFRLFQWFLPIPIAWILLKVGRRGRPTLPSTSELRAYARGDVA
ncbi:MAG TPA: lysylphosphatidylglycerol synthase domain-containing protein [Candidatus Limnocylindrales bacterium]|nr:lysylphosphatidylglycerol synthase domain-containing protein [Candidatus Limnocylindrales bacterium]